MTYLAGLFAVTHASRELIYAMLGEYSGTQGMCWWQPTCGAIVSQPFISFATLFGLDDTTPITCPRCLVAMDAAREGQAAYALRDL